MLINAVTAYQPSEIIGYFRISWSVSVATAYCVSVESIHNYVSCKPNPTGGSVKFHNRMGEIVRNGKNVRIKSARLSEPAGLCEPKDRTLCSAG
jgi:hypothetical protein